MTVCNAVFWDSEKARWDGSKDVLRSCGCIAKVPAQKYVPPLSASSLTTAVLTLQGVQASFIIFLSLNPKSTYRLGQGLPYVFIPLGCLGLMRLPAALRLSGDYDTPKFQRQGMAADIPPPTLLQRPRSG